MALQEARDLAAPEFHSMFGLRRRRPRAAATTEFGRALAAFGIKHRSVARWFHTSERNIRRWKSGMAARGARAASGQAADDRGSRRGHAFVPRRTHRRFCTATARTRLDRGSQCHDRGSLGRGTQRAICRDRRRVRPLKVDVIVTHNTPPPLAAKQATSVIPIVFATAGDPVGTGVVESLARPGGNVTGLSSQHPDVSGKRLELLRELVPGLRRLAFLAEPGNPFSALELSEVRTAARTLGLEVMPVEIQRGGLQEGRKNANIESVWDSSGESRSKSTLGGTTCRLSLPQFFSSLSFLERYSTCLTMELR